SFEFTQRILPFFLSRKQSSQSVVRRKGRAPSARRRFDEFPGLFRLSLIAADQTEQQQHVIIFWQQGHGSAQVLAGQLCAPAAEELFTNERHQGAVRRIKFNCALQGSERIVQGSVFKQKKAFTYQSLKVGALRAMVVPQNLRSDFIAT